MRVQLSRRVARFNRRVNNPLQRQYAWLLPPWAVIVHRGRRSGTTYRTPVNAFRHGDTLAVVILYGERSDWVQNVLAGGGQVVRGGRTYQLRSPRIAGPDDPALSIPARRVGRLSGKLLVASLEGPLPGFGRGPR
ncbi:MAG TPA: nitroreductase family deazaflavin-dependent oxidoreductase [Solirubrobacteraceae bacterium]|nr:nitroreductase family deazaflavin-dependent oxidoreductase [Solirubrobacteraceae bacterium]